VAVDEQRTFRRLAGCDAWTCPGAALNPQANPGPVLTISDARGGGPCRLRARAESRAGGVAGNTPALRTRGRCNGACSHACTGTFEECRDPLLEPRPRNSATVTHGLENCAVHPFGTAEKYPGNFSEEGHFYMECSNEGLCNRDDVTAECFPGYGSLACLLAGGTLH